MTGSARIRIDVEIEADGWNAALPEAVDLARRAGQAALARSGGEVVILLTDDDAVRELNARFRGKDAATNVLSFPAAAMPGGGPEGPLGDIALALGVCAAEADARNIPLADHVSHLVIHGVLHLLGYDHEDDAQARVMEALEVALLADLGVADPYAPGRHDNDEKAAHPDG